MVSFAFEVILREPSGDGKLDAKPESFKIDVSEANGTTTVRIRGADVRGAMYGGLDVAEQIRLNSTVKAKSESPYLPVRAMKFNPPLKGQCLHVGRRPEEQRLVLRSRLLGSIHANHGLQPL